MSRYGTPFVETEALLAADLRDGDDEELDRVLGTMSDSELRRLADTADRLSLRCEVIIEDRDESRDSTTEERSPEAIVAGPSDERASNLGDEAIDQSTRSS
jgi:hypothetical protein